MILNIDMNGENNTYLQRDAKLAAHFGNYTWAKTNGFRSFPELEEPNQSLLKTKSNE